MAAAQQQYDQLYKVLLVGDSGVGKSSILIRYTEDSFADDVPATIGVDFKTKFVALGDRRIKLTIWDTAGQERFRTLTSSYYRNAQGVILVYSVDNRPSFESITTWLRELETYKNVPQVAMMLVANKIDTERSRWQVDPSEGERFAKEKGMLFLECSAKTRKGIQEAFDELVHQIAEISNNQGQPVNQGQPQGISLQDRARQGVSSYCCL
jgi:Ras-related protein Rab-18